MLLTDLLHGNTHDAGRSWAYAEGLASHMYKQHVIEWLTDEQLFGVMVALVKDSRRRNQ